jgi:hypothetical protein
VPSFPGKGLSGRALPARLGTGVVVSGVWIGGLAGRVHRGADHLGDLLAGGRGVGAGLCGAQFGVQPGDLGVPVADALPGGGQLLGQAVALVLGVLGAVAGTGERGLRVGQLPA